jgi:hypothetical protein
MSLITETTEETEATTEEETVVTEETVAEETPSEEETESTEEEKLYVGKYKSVEDLEAGYKELTKKIREKTPEAPEKYELDFTDDEDLKGLVPEGTNLNEDEMFIGMSDVFKKHNLTQEAVNDIVKAKLMHDASLNPDFDTEMKKLGDNANDRIVAVSKFVQKNFSESEQALLADVGSTAEGVALVEKLMKMSKVEARIPTTETSQSVGLSSAELKSKAAELRKTPGFDLNTKMRSQYEELMDQAAKLDINS